MPSILHENSGIAFIKNSDLLYAINDSGNSSTVFGLDIKSGKIIKEIKLNNTGNDDWEDLTTDNNYLYVGDFGNNKNKRENLSIYWIPNGIILDKSGKDNELKSTQFYLEDQKKFPPKKKDRNFDIESFFTLGDYFYLFTRNRSSKFDGTTKLYRLKKQSGKQKAILISKLKVCDTKKTCQITSAALHKPTGKVALLTYDKVLIFENYKKDDFFTGNSKVIELDHLSQKESITFQDKNTLIITEEKELSGIGGNIYKLVLN